MYVCIYIYNLEYGFSNCLSVGGLTKSKYKKGKIYKNKQIISHIYLLLHSSAGNIIQLTPTVNYSFQFKVIYFNTANISDTVTTAVM